MFMNLHVTMPSVYISNTCTLLVFTCLFNAFKIIYFCDYDYYDYQLNCINLIKVLCLHEVKFNIVNDLSDQQCINRRYSGTFCCDVEMKFDCH